MQVLSSTILNYFWRNKNANAPKCLGASSTLMYKNLYIWWARVGQYSWGQLPVVDSWIHKVDNTSSEKYCKNYLYYFENKKSPCKNRGKTQHKGITDSEFVFPAEHQQILVDTNVSIYMIE